MSATTASILLIAAALMLFSFVLAAFVVRVLRLERTLDGLQVSDEYPLLGGQVGHLATDRLGIRGNGLVVVGFYSPYCVDCVRSARIIDSWALANEQFAGSAVFQSAGFASSASILRGTKVLENAEDVFRSFAVDRDSRRVVAAPPTATTR